MKLDCTCNVMELDSELVRRRGFTRWYELKAACSRHSFTVVHVTTSGRVDIARSRGSTNIHHHVDEFILCDLLKARDHFVHMIL